MISPCGVYLFDFIGKGNNFVDDQLEEVVGRRFSCQQLEFVIDGTDPDDNDEESYLRMRMY